MRDYCSSDQKKNLKCEDEGFQVVDDTVIGMKKTFGGDVEIYS